MTKSPNPPRYWLGYDTVLEAAAAAEDNINALDDTDPRYGLNRFDAEVDNLWPLLWIISSRSKNEHFVCATRPASETRAPERHCTCGLIVEATDLVDTPEALKAFESALGHIEWRMRDPEHDVVPLNDPETEVAPE